MSTEKKSVITLDLNDPWVQEHLGILVKCSSNHTYQLIAGLSSAVNTKYSHHVITAMLDMKDILFVKTDDGCSYEKDQWMENILEKCLSTPTRLTKTELILKYESQKYEWDGRKLSIDERGYLFVDKKLRIITIVDSIPIGYTSLKGMCGPSIDSYLYNIVKSFNKDFSAHCTQGGR